MWTHVPRSSRCAAHHWGGRGKIWEAEGSLSGMASVLRGISCRVFGHTRDTRPIASRTFVTVSEASPNGLLAARQKHGGGKSQLVPCLSVAFCRGQRFMMSAGTRGLHARRGGSRRLCPLPSTLSVGSGSPGARCLRGDQELVCEIESHEARPDPVLTGMPSPCSAGKNHGTTLGRKASLRVNLMSQDSEGGTICPL